MNSVLDRLKLLCLCSFLCLASAGPYAKCPDESTITPCVCEKSCDSCTAEISCSNIASQEVLSDVMERSGDYPFRIFNLRDSVLAYMPAIAFEKKKYMIMTAENCTFSSLLDQPLKGELPLFWFKINNVKVQRGASFEFFNYFEELRFLNIKHMPVKKVTKKMMSNLPSTIQELTFNHTDIKRLHPEVFSRFETLSIIAVSHSYVKEIEASMFPKGTMDLDLSYNQIELIPEDFMKHFNRINKLKLDNNQITTLDEAAIGRGIPFSVMFISLKDNPVTCDCKVKWVIDIKYAIRGTCVNDNADFKGKEFKDITKEDLNYC